MPGPEWPNAREVVVSLALMAVAVFVVLIAFVMLSPNALVQP